MYELDKPKENPLAVNKTIYRDQVEIISTSYLSYFLKQNTIDLGTSLSTKKSLLSFLQNFIHKIIT